MEYRVLGPLEVLRDGRVVEIRGTKRRAVLALLLLHANEVVRTERLVEEVWGERRPANAAAALHNHVSRLRKALGADVFVTKPWGYVVRATADEIDLHRFTTLVAEAAALPAQERAERLAEALSLWRGPALADLLDEPALAAEADRLEDLRLAALEERIDADLELGRSGTVIAELEVLIAQQPLRERLRGQLIVALYRSGRQAEALGVYRETRRVLVEELGIEPGPELRNLEQAVLRHDPELTSGREPPTLAAATWPRRPATVLLAAAVPILAVGIATAMLLTRSTPRRAVVSTARPAPLTAIAVRRRPPATTSRTDRRATTRTQPQTTTRTQPLRQPTTRTRAQATTHRQPQTTSKHGATTVTARPATIAPPPQTTKRTTTTQPATTQARTPAVRWVWAPADTFADDAKTNAMWQAWTSGTGIHAGNHGSRLEITIDASAEPDAGRVLEAGYRFRCTVLEDFDLQVDFQLIDWPTNDGIQLSLGIGVGGGADGALWTVARASAGNRAAYDAYVATVGARNGAVQTNDLSGTLRLVRSARLVTAYYKGTAGWIRIASAPEPRFAEIMLLVQADPGVFGHRTAVVAYDNFRATAPDMFCPGPYFPPRTRSR